MGVKGFAKWLRAHYPTAFHTTHPRSYEYVYVDMNSLLHCASRHSRTELQLHRQTRRHLLEVHRRYGPMQKLFLAIDGPASLVKVEEQRRRRKECSLVAQRTGMVDAQQFTPGCCLMTRLEEFLQNTLSEEIGRRLEKGMTPRGKRLTFPNKSLEFILSGSDVPGEGEVKIFRELAGLRGRGGSHAILTTDSDLLLHAIGHAIPQVYIIPPPWDMGKCGEILSTDILLRLLCSQVGSGYETKQILTDFCFLVSLSGNDYLPAMQFGNFSSLWPIYCKEKDICLIDLANGELRLDGLARLLGSWQISDGFTSHRGLQRRWIETQKVQLSADERVARNMAFLRGVLTVAHQLCGSPWLPSPAIESPVVPLHIRYPYREGPSVGELVEILEKTSIQYLAPTMVPDPFINQGYGVNSQAGLSEIPHICSITAPLLTLEPRETSLNYLPEQIRPLAREFWQLLNQSVWDNDEAALRWLQGRLAVLYQNQSITKRPTPKNSAQVIVASRVAKMKEMETTIPLTESTSRHPTTPIFNPIK